MPTSLGEILSAKGDADYSEGGEGGSAPVYNNALTLEYLNQAAQVKAQTNQYLLEQHDKNLQDALANVNNVNFNGLMPADANDLQDQYASVLQNTAQNFGALRNPLSDPQGYAALKTNESAFRQKLSQSQQDAAYLATQQKFVDAHPEFNTPKYRQDVQDFVNAPLGQRKYFTVAPPLIFNPNAAYSAISELSKKKYSTSTTNGKYITDQEGEQYDPDKFVQLGTTLQGTDQNGVPLEVSRHQQFDQLPANIKQLYGNDYPTYVQQQLKAYLPENQVTKSDIKPDEYGTLATENKNDLNKLKIQEGFEAGQADARNALEQQRIDIEKAEQKKGQLDKNALGEYKNQLYYNAVNGNSNTENIPNDALQTIYGNDSPVEIKTGNATMGEPVQTIKKPTTEVVGNWNDGQGNVIVKLKSNVDHPVMNYGGKQVVLKDASKFYTIKVPYAKFYGDLNNIKGTDNAPLVDDGSRTYLKNIGAVDENDPKLHGVFAPQTKPATTTSATGLSNDAYNAFLKKNGLQ